MIRTMTLMVVSAGFFMGAASAGEPVVASLQQAGAGHGRFSNGFDAASSAARALPSRTPVLRCGDGSVAPRLAHELWSVSGGEGRGGVRSGQEVDDVCSLLANRWMDTSDRSEALAARLTALGGDAPSWLVPVVRPEVRCTTEVASVIDRDGDVVGREATGRTRCVETGAATVSTWWVAHDGAVLFQGARRVPADARSAAMADIVPGVGR